MEKKEFCNEYGKSIALTLRMCKRLRGTGRVIIADSWFGSVACAIALYTMGLFAVMNVKTATTNYPKDALMEHVAEIKGTGAEAKKARKERRGTAVAMTQEVEVGGNRTITLLAAGHNKKVPLLLITTALTMLPGEEHNKVWKVNHADGSVETHALKTEQPEVHALYCLYRAFRPPQHAPAARAVMGSPLRLTFHSQAVNARHGFKRIRSPCATVATLLVKTEACRRRSGRRLRGGESEPSQRYPRYGRRCPRLLASGAHPVEAATGYTCPTQATGPPRCRKL